jgi:dTDP-D-glucose 4,6-dehydratase
MRKGQLHEIYNIGTTVDISIHDMCVKLIRIMKEPDINPDDWIEHVEDRAFNDSRYMIDSTKLNDLIWQANLDFDTLLREMVKWYFDNLDWWPSEFIQAYLSPHPLAYGPKNVIIERSSSQIELEAIPT